MTRPLRAFGASPPPLKEEFKLISALSTSLSITLRGEGSQRQPKALPQCEIPVNLRDRLAVELIHDDRLGLPTLLGVVEVASAVRRKDFENPNYDCGDAESAEDAQPDLETQNRHELEERRVGLRLLHDD